MRKEIAERIARELGIKNVNRSKRFASVEFHLGNSEDFTFATSTDYNYDTRKNHDFRSNYANSTIIGAEGKKHTKYIFLFWN